jgi:hypothetical protein
MPRPTRASDRARGVRRALAAMVASAALSVSVPSCVSVLGLDGFRGAAEELCSLLERCYGDKAIPECLPHVSGALDGADAEDSKAWLVEFADQSCLESCSTARRCLDQPPVCQTVGSTCDSLEKCCGFSKGFGSCDAEDDECCRPKGTPCKNDEECCADAGRCDEGTKTCGGVVCAPSGDACAVSAECCTKICLTEGLCAEDVCTPDGGNCSDDLTCCAGVCSDGVCGVIGCTPEGGECFDPGECCDDLVCFAAAEGIAVCSTSQCLPEFSACQGPDECCSAYCDPQFLVCGELPPQCQPFGSSCSPEDVCCEGVCFDGACGCVPDLAKCTFHEDCCGGVCEGEVCKPAGCGPLLAGCNSDGDCCTSSCNLGSCAWACPNGAPAIDCTHGVCSEGSGTALDPTCPGVDVDCVIKVCEQDVYCCCNTWDSICVDAVGPVCMQSCATN